MAERTFKFLHEDAGYYRAYYRRNETRALYCIQNEGAWGKDRFVFNLCSSDGEPDHAVEFPPEAAFDRLIYPASLEK